MTHQVDILIPSCNRPGALAITLTSLIYQTFTDFRIVISDQSEDADIFESKEVQAVIRVLNAHGHPVETYRHLPRRGMAEQRHFLSSHISAPYALFSDDDLIYEPYVIRNLLLTIQKEGCGFVGSPVIGLSYIDDHRPEEEVIEFWNGPVEPEEVRPGSTSWRRAWLHNAANTYHVQQKLGLHPDHPQTYKVAWVGGCVLFDTTKLREVGAFSFWQDLPEKHSGEDVLAQINLMRRYGGCGILPSGVYHLELPTTVPDREIDAPFYLDPFKEEKSSQR